MKVVPVNLVNFRSTAKVEKKDKPQPQPEPSPLEKLFLFILFELENIKKSGKPKV
jgi:hypothetical protein